MQRPAGFRTRPRPEEVFELRRRNRNRKRQELLHGPLATGRQDLLDRAQDRVGQTQAQKHLGRRHQDAGFSAIREGLVHCFLQEQERHLHQEGCHVDADPQPVDRLQQTSHAGRQTLAGAAVHRIPQVDQRGGHLHHDHRQRLLRAQDACRVDQRVRDEYL